MADEKLKKIAEKLKGKKAKKKKLKDEPKDTKSAKPPKDVLETLEETLGADLKKVKVHTGGNVPDLCKDMKSKAFTMGNNIYLEKPGDAKNKELLAHELTHVIQHGNGKMPKEKKGEALVSK